MPNPPNRSIQCWGIHGRAQEFPAGELRFRPAAYGIALHPAGRVLLARSAFHKRWELPGGAVDPWESLPEGLAREFAEEMGIAPTVGPFIGFDEGFFAFFSHAFHSLRFFYAVSVPQDVVFTLQPKEVTDVAWKPLVDLEEAELTRGHLQFIRQAAALREEA